MTFQLARVSMGALAVCALSLATPAHAATTVIYDATGGSENGGDSFKSAGRILVDQVASGTVGGKLASVTLNVKLNHVELGSFDVVVADVSHKTGLPFHRQVVATVQDSTLSKTFQLITVKSTLAVVLAPNTQYYVGIAAHKGGKSTVQLGNTLDPMVLSRASVMAGGYYYNNGGVQANAGGPYEILVKLTP